MDNRYISPSGRRRRGSRRRCRSRCRQIDHIDIFGTPGGVNYQGKTANIRIAIPRSAVTGDGLIVAGYTLPDIFRCGHFEIAVIVFAILGTKFDRGKTDGLYIPMSIPMVAHTHFHSGRTAISGPKSNVGRV